MHTNQPQTKDHHGSRGDPGNEASHSQTGSPGDLTVPSTAGRHSVRIPASAYRVCSVTMPTSPDGDPQPPPLPIGLLSVWPVIAVGALAWLIAAVIAFCLPALASWRPVTIAGLGVGLLGTGIFTWQRAAARRGARGAQEGLQAHLEN